jgi:hypothetical protein
MLRNELRFELQSKDREIAYNEKRSDDAQRALDKAREKVPLPPMRVWLRYTFFCSFVSPTTLPHSW